MLDEWTLQRCWDDKRVLMPGVTLTTVVQASGSSGVHEGVHLGLIVCVRKLIDLKE